MDNINPQLIELYADFNKIDTDNNGLINQTQLKNYMNDKHISFKLHQLKELFRVAKSNTINVKQFTTWILSVKSDMVAMSYINLSLEKLIKDHSDANPPGTDIVCKKSKISLVVDDEKMTPNTQLQSLVLHVGSHKQEAKKLGTIMQKQATGVYFMLKLRVSSKLQQMKEKLEIGLQTLVQIVKQMLPEMKNMLDALRFKVIAKNEHDLYIICEFQGILFQDLASYVKEFLMMLSPNCEFYLTAKMQSSMFKSLLAKGLNSQIKHLQVDINLDIDSQTLKKMKQIVLKNNDQIINKTSQQFTSILLFTLFQELELNLYFKKVSQILQILGVTQNQLDFSQKTKSIKQMGIAQTLGSFSPEMLQVLQGLKQVCEKQIELSIHIDNFCIKLQSNLNVQGAFDLIL